MKGVLSKLLMLAGGLVAAAPAMAQGTYPARPVTMVVPFAAGGPTDIVARVTAEHMARTLGQPVVIENVVGAGGTIGAGRVAKAKPDGYTIIMGHMGTHAASVALYPKLSYKPDVDFAPIGMVAGTPVLILARKDFPPKDLKEFVSYVKSNVGKLNMAHAGVGSVSFTTCLLLNSLLGVKPTSIPFTGTGPALTALISGQVDYMCDQIVNVVQQVESGQIRAYAIGTAERNPALPNVPTTKEAGLPEFSAQAWNALFAPRGTPPEIVERLSAALDQALDDPGVRKRLLDLGSVLPDKAGRGGAALGSVVKSEIGRWTKVIESAGPIEP